jgi:hypothetical protein
MSGHGLEQAYHLVKLRMSHRGRQLGEQGRLIDGQFRCPTGMAGAMVWFSDGEHIVFPRSMLQLVACPHRAVAVQGTKVEDMAGTLHDTGGRCVECNELINPEWKEKGA